MAEVKSMNKKSLNAKKQFRLMNNNCQNGEADFWGCSLPPDPKLTAEGWERRFIADARMARDAVDTYSELGFEVRLEPFNTDELSGECNGCKILFKKFSTVYTRKKKSK